MSSVVLQSFQHQDYNLQTSRQKYARGLIVGRTRNISLIPSLNFTWDQKVRDLALSFDHSRLRHVVGS